MGTASPTTAVVRYHPILVVLHWGLALLVLAALALGALKMAPTPNSDPAKSEALRAHMTGGLVILVLMLVRLVTRRSTSHPPKASTGIAALDRLAALSHKALYVLVIAMALSGLVMGLQTGIIGLMAGGIRPSRQTSGPFRSVAFTTSSRDCSSR